MNNVRKYLSTCLLATVALLVGTFPAWAQQAPPLGAAAAFTLLGGAAVSCTDGVVIGDVGAGAAFSNTRCMITGAVPLATTAATGAALLASASAYTALQGMPCGTTLTGDLSGQTLPPGVYCFGAAAALAGTLTLDGPSSGVWIFQVKGALAGTSNAVVMSGGGQACNVYWGSDGATSMTDSAFKGNILAGNGAIALIRGSHAGRALASAAVAITGASVIGCGALAGPAACKDKDHEGDDEDKDKDKAKDKDKDRGSDAKYPFGQKRKD